MGKITGYTDLYALFGNPVEHSKSPEMYNYTYDKLGMDAVYVALTAEEDNMENTFNFIRSSGLKGGNLTMPVKTKGAEFADELTDSARLIGAVNCFKNENGKIIGHNTDGKGFVHNLFVNGHDVKDQKVVLIGAGAAGTAISVQTMLDGAAELTIFNQDDRFYASAEKLADKLQKEFPDKTVAVARLEDTEVLNQKISEAAFLFDATKVGMGDLEGQTNVDPSVLHKDLVVGDTVYSPLETQMIVDAKAAGVKAAFGGIGMLLYQGAVGFEFWTGQEMPVEDVKRDIYGL